MANTFNVANAVVNLDAGTAEFTLKMAQAGATVKNFGADGEAAVNRVKAAMHGIVPEQIAASAAIRSLEGNPGIRAAERFLTTTLGLRGAISAAFPVIGALAFADVLVTMVDRAQKFYKEVSEGAARVKLAFSELNGGAQVANDALAVSNARLENEIAKLTGKRENGLKVMFLEAKEAADKLGESIEKDLKSLLKLIEEEKIGTLSGFFTGRQSTGDLQKPVEQLQRRIGDIRSDTQDKTEGLTKPADIAAVRREANRQIIKAIEDTENELNVELDKIAKARADAAKQREQASHHASPLTGLPDDQISQTEDRRQQVSGTLRNLRDLRNSVNLQNTHDDLTEQVSGLKANEANDKLTKPYDAAIASLKGKIAEVNTLIAAAGSSDASKVIAKGLAEAAKEAEHLNEQLSKQGGLTAAQKAEINKLSVLVSQGQAREKLLTQADEEVKKNTESAAGQRLIADAIGKTYEAARAAAVQIEVLKKLGESANSKDPNVVSARARIESSTGTAFDAEHNTQAQNAIFLLRQQAESQDAQTQAVVRGAAAVRLAVEIEKEADLVRTQGIFGYVAASAARAAFLSGEKKDSTGRTDVLKQEAADIRALAIAYVGGAEAIKDAQLEIEKARIARNTPKGVDAKPEQDAAGDKDRAQRQGEIAKSAGESVNHFKDQLDALDKQRAAIQAMVVTEQNRVGIAIALKQIYDEQNRIIREQVLAVGSAADGARQFLRDLVTESTSAAQRIHEVFRSAYDGINEQLSRLITGQKTSFASFFQGLGQQLVKQQLQQIEKLVLTGGLKDQLGNVIKGQVGGGVLGTGQHPGASGKPSLFGIKRDGNTPQTAFFVSLVDPNSGTAIPTGGGAPAAKSDSGLGKLIRIILSGGQSQINGPVIGQHDLTIPDSSHSVSPISIPRGGSGGQINNTYYIDARDATDPLATERRVKAAIEQSQTQTISASVQASREYAMRIPQ